MYSSENIVWIKNVKRNDGESWAYDNVVCGEDFDLHWPTSKKGSAHTPNVGDIIVLFQKINFINGKRNRKVHFTHLVSPVSNDVFPDEKSPKHKWCRKVKLIAKPTPIESIPNPGYYNFFLPNRGLTNPIINLVNNIGLSESETQSDVWNYFQPFICPNLLTQIYNPINPIGIYGEIEGDKIIVEHIKYEIKKRNSKIVQIAKDAAMQKGKGRILCECCDFDFFETYGSHGLAFIECHHINHLSNGKRETFIEDLAMVCSNCHRMLHRRNFDKEYYSVGELKNIIEKERHSS